MLQFIKHLVLICVISVAPAHSKSLHYQYNEIISQVKSVGSAKFSMLFWDIYQSTLYTATGRYEQGIINQPMLFQIKYLRDIRADDLIEKTAEQWRHIGVLENKFSPFIPQLKAIWPNINQGDSLSLYVKDGVSYFYCNEKPIGQINDENFGPMFLDIWLSSKTSQPKLRKQLIGETS